MPSIIPSTPSTDGGTGGTNIHYYSPNSTYRIGDQVLHIVEGEGKYGIYMCIVTIVVPEAWNSSHWKFQYSEGGSAGGSGSYNTKTCKLVLAYNANGASGTPPSTQTDVYSGEKKEVTLKRMVQSQGELTYTNRYFIGWLEGSASSSTIIDPGYVYVEVFSENESGTRTKKLYAKWSSNGRIIYKPGQYANESNNAWHDKYQEIPASGNVELRGAIFTRKGYNLTGWVYDNNYFADINASISVSDLPSSEVVLYPSWTPKTYTITFKSNDASLNQQDISLDSVPFDSTPTMLSNTAFRKDGYHISLWNERSDGSGGAWFPGKTYLYNIDRNLNLYAQWSGNEYNVVYCSDEETANQIILASSVNCPSIGLDENNNVISESEDYPFILTSDNLLVFGPSILELDTGSSEDHSVAIYGSPFYTDYRPESKENYSFNGWMSIDGITLTKKDVWMDAYSLDQNSIWTRMDDLILYPIWSEKYPYGKIFFGRKESSDYNLIVNSPPSYHWPEYQYNHENVHGKNGDILTDYEYYKNVAKQYSIVSYVKDDPKLAARQVSDFLHRYNGTGKYIRLEDSYEPDVFMLGVYEESNNLMSILGQAWSATVEFNCKPQKYLLKGNRRIDIISSGTIIHNPTNCPARPLIYIWGTGDIHFLGYPTRILDSEKTYEGALDDAPLKDVLLTIYNNYNQIIIDSESFNATNIQGQNVNSNINLLDRILLYPGDNEITFAGDIEKISIIPRWWRL